MGDEDLYGVDITRSMLSRNICMNEECKGAIEFGELGIGPLSTIPKPPTLFYRPPPPRPETADVTVQSPKQYPCGDPRCLFLNVHDDGSPVGCGKPNCRFAARSTCDNPDCIHKQSQQRPIVCATCGGYSLSGKTCKDMNIVPEPPPPSPEPEPEPEPEPTEPKMVCDPECVLPVSPDSVDKKTVRAPPPTDAPFDLLQNAIRLDKLRDVHFVFEEELGLLNEFLMDLFEEHFEPLRPPLDPNTPTRGEVSANNNFYNFFLEAVKVCLTNIRKFLLQVWNDSVKTYTTDIKEPKFVPNVSAELRAPIENITDDLVDFLIMHFGMESMSQQLSVFMYGLITRAVDMYKVFLPGPGIPSSPRSSEDPAPVVAFDAEAEEEPVTEVVPVKKTVPVGDMYPGVILGHKFCVPHGRQGPPVPKNMGWLWNLGMHCGRLKPLRFYKPGAMHFSVAKIIREHQALLGKAPPPAPKKPKRKKTLGEDEEELKPVLVVQKKDGCYMITMNPLKNPYWSDEENEEYSPLTFLVTKNKDKIMKVNADGSCDCLCECNFGDESTGTSSTSMDDIEIEYTPPIALTDPIDARPKKNRVDNFTVYSQADCGTPASAGAAKKGKGK